VCGPGTFKPSPGAAACDTCPSNSNSPVGSLVVTACTCNAGSGAFGPNGGACIPCVAGKYKIASGDATCSSCVAGQYSTMVGATTLACLSCSEGFTSPEGSSAESACQVPQSQQVPVGPRIEFQVMMPYSTAGFTLVLQRFIDAIASVASAGCQCTIDTEDVDITRISEVTRRLLVGRPPASRRLQATSESINVDVKIMVINVAQGNLLVQNNYLTRDAMNKELAKERVASITQVTASPVLHTMEDASTASPTTLEPAQSSASSGAQTVGIVVAAFAVVAIVAGVSYYCGKRHSKVAVGPATVEDVKRREEEEEALKRNLVEEARKRNEEEETARKRSEQEEGE